jgi:alkylation response protein AidB-like acyl-CoA dehydrogenase
MSNSNVEAVAADNPAVAAHVTDVALECVEVAYRLAGSRALYTPNVIERLLRDIHGASQHACVQHFHYTETGSRLVQAVRGAPDVVG